MLAQTDRAPAAEELTARILQFLAEDPGRMARFFTVTGLSAKTIRAAAAAPGFAASVLDYLLEDEPLLQLFAASAEIAPSELLRVPTGLERREEGALKTERRAVAPVGASNLARRFGCV